MQDLGSTFGLNFRPALLQSLCGNAELLTSGNPNFRTGSFEPLCPADPLTHARTCYRDGWRGRGARA